MKMKLLFVSFFIGLFFYWLPQPEPVKNVQVGDSVVKASPLNTDFVIRNVRLFDGQQAMESVDVLVRDNRIYRIGRNIENLQGFKFPKRLRTLSLKNNDDITIAERRRIKRIARKRGFKVKFGT